MHAKVSLWSGLEISSRQWNPTEVQSVDDGFLIYTKGGKKASKSQLVNAWKALFGSSVTGHSARRSGALQYIRQGWAISQVAFLGRWKSQGIYNYAQEALESMPVNASQTFGTSAQQGSNTGQTDTQKDLAREQAIRKMGKEVESLEKKTDLLKIELEAVKLDGEGMKTQLAEEVEKLEAKSLKNKGFLPKLVVCTRTKVTHWNLPSAICSNLNLEDNMRMEVWCGKLHDRRGHDGWCGLPEV